MKQKAKLTTALSLLCSILTFGQSIEGKVVDEKGEAISFVDVIQKNTINGVTTDRNGRFTIEVKEFPVTLHFSMIGYETVEKRFTESTTVTVLLKEENAFLDEVVLTGNRSKPRTILDSAVPIDNIDARELEKSGQPTFDRMLVFKVPSFNSQNQAITDATAHYDPADLRGLGPSRTLVLINGKRKNQSAQVYLNRTPGKGEVGVDLRSIPSAAIKRVEVLRDGASALYGSDAIAGVMNIILKKDVEFSTLTTRAGMTSQRDGFNFNTDFNTTFKFGDGGFANLTLGYYNQKLTNRAGRVVPSEEGATRPNEIAWLAANPTAGMTVGQPEMEKKDVFVNLEHPVGEKAKLYSFHGFSTRDGKSFAYYRAPYWRRDVADANFLTKSAENFKGYQPTFEASINDYINTGGIEFGLAENWTADASVTYGANDVFYTINNSVNRSYLKDHGTSPTTFKPGGYRFTNVIGNFDVTGTISEKLNTAIGFEYKKESFRAFQGDHFSYYGEGTDSFAGITPEEAGKWTRSNFAAYAQLDYDVTESLLLGAAGRYEDFSDSGSNFSWKVNGRVKIGENGAVRASYSTGFRAPSLHQRHLTNSQYIRIPGQTEPSLQKTFANNDPIIRALGVPDLTHELSRNISAGITYKFNKDFSASLDLYQIDVYNRILFSSQIGYKKGNGPDQDKPATPKNDVERILYNNDVLALQFFINAGDTRTRGADLVLNYRNIEIGEGKFSANLAANLNETTIEGVETPGLLAEHKYNMFDRQEQGLITNSRPRSKFILGLNYDINKWAFSLNNTRFGKVIVTAPEAGGKDQTLSAKIATDFGFIFKLTDKVSLNGNINNIFDVYPDPTNPNTNTAEAGRRFTYSSEVQQLGQLGRNFSAGLNLSF